MAGAEKRRTYKMDSGPLAERLEKARQLAIEVLGNPGKPTMSLEELRRRMDEELPPGFSLSEFLIKEREAGW